MDLLTAPTNVLGAAVVSAIVTGGITVWTKRSENRHKVQVDYEYEQRRKLRALIGLYHGRFLQAAESLSHRMENLYTNYDKRWLDRGNEKNGYYLSSTVFRFLRVSALIRQLESEALLLDPKIASKEDFTFLSFVAALHWVMTDVALFDGLTYDPFDERDHFFSDHLRSYSKCCVEADRLLAYEEFEAGPATSSGLAPVFAFFSGLHRDEDRYRWDRMVAMHLLLMAFLNVFGYKRQKCRAEEFAHAASMVQNPGVLVNLVNWLPKHDLATTKAVRQMTNAIAPYMSVVSAVNRAGYR